ncbi:sugar dehydrogenase complex small subunit [Rhizobium sp. SYY.PMSO]|uniref:sugar dehydrogenase complex small subunit n=1 Tax=Rhizobium sp. SYY.PMSO TaxID=3382192 RepID=UPI0013AFD9EC
MTREQDDQAGSTAGGAVSGYLKTTRRQLLAGSTLLLADLAFHMPALAETAPAAIAADPAFLALSRKITGKDQLSPVTAERIHVALSADDPALSDKLGKLAGLSTSAASPAALKQAASAVGLDGLMMAIVSAWYTGTVDTKAGPVVVAYKDALMYQPVADGLTVPTYCSRGPLWWSDLPPQVTRVPQNNPKVL